MVGYDGRGARFDIIAVEGSDLSFTVTAVDAAGDGVNISGDTITATVYDLTGVTAGTLSTVVSGDDGNIITVAATDSVIDALTAPATWSLVVTRSGDDRTWLAGDFVRTTPDDARTGTSGTAVTATVDTNVTVTAQVLSAIVSATTNVDGGTATSNYGGTTAIDGGSA